MDLLKDKSYPRFLPPGEVQNRNLFYKISQLHSDDQFFPAEDEMLYCDSHFYVHSILDTQVADLVDLKYVSTVSEKPAPGRWDNPAPNVYINRRAFPRAFLAGGYRVSAWDWEHHWETMYTLLRTGMPDLRSVVILKEYPKIEGDLKPGIAGDAGIVSYTNNRVELECQAQRPCFLLLSDNYFPHWKAWVDDKPVPLYQADMAFRAVPIETAGKHHVVMAYCPTHLYAGLVVSFLSWLGLVWVLRKGRDLPLDFSPRTVALFRAVVGVRNR